MHEQEHHAHHQSNTKASLASLKLLASLCRAEARAGRDACAARAAVCAPTAVSFLWFLAAPTLVYQASFPRAPRSLRKAAMCVPPTLAPNARNVE